jgi:rRNA-processing protein FCF1
MLNLAALGGVFGGEKSSKKSFKILDTSVIIDGRIADIAETGFLDGVLVIPQFVLRELQLVADSADSMKRNRGRRGLDILQRVQKMAHLNVQIVEQDFPHVREVDMKLIELAKVFDCKVVTNDFNLNKVAQLHGVEVLNINELANSLKPIVLPGETMRVFILKEGKEPGRAWDPTTGWWLAFEDDPKDTRFACERLQTPTQPASAAVTAFLTPERHDRPMRKSEPQPVTNPSSEKTTIES